MAQRPLHSSAIAAWHLIRRQHSADLDRSPWQMLLGCRSQGSRAVMSSLFEGTEPARFGGPEQADVGGWQKEARGQGNTVTVRLLRSIIARVFFLYLHHEADTPSVLSQWDLPPIHTLCFSLFKKNRAFL